MLEIAGMTGELAWQEDGICANDKSLSTSDFFLEGLPRDQYSAAKKKAKAACARCPIKQRCLEFALKHDHKDGIWGGLTRAEREQLLYPRKKLNGKLVYLSQIESAS